MDREQFSDWIALYERLWRTEGTDLLGELFSEAIVYSNGPFEEPVQGLEALAKFWEAERVSADEHFEITSEIVAVEGATGVARLEVRYSPPDGNLYRDLWIVQVGADGRCIRFEEWPFWPKLSTEAG
ncbi:MAG TPA: nuclear transport factor 2 family protein [Solirubrobacterales bacterium]|nr:nuclear transport factor 2 family protein [Solirubrobacterales bacterium]